MSASKHIIKIEPSILIWARESLGLSLDDVANRIKKEPEIIHQWEEGKSYPTLSQLEKLAYDIYKRPLAVFFLPEPPKETTPKQDFRTLPDKEISKLSPQLRLVVRKAKHNQLVLKQIYEGSNPSKKPLHREFTFRNTSNPETSAKKLREYLGITRELQKSWKNPKIAFNAYRDLLETNGIFVFQYPLPQARGFSLMDKEFPVIVINNSDSPNGKIFTLIHELCHILFNVGGVFRDVNSGELKKDLRQIEVFCNYFAADFLLPSDELLNETIVKANKGNTSWEDETLESLAFTFKVSKEVVLRKLLNLNLTTNKFYETTTKKWRDNYQKSRDKKKQKQSGGNYHATNMSYLGRNFITQVLTRMHQGRLTPTQVSDFLGIRINRIREYEQKLF